MEVLKIGDGKQVVMGMNGVNADARARIEEVYGRDLKMHWKLELKDENLVLIETVLIDDSDSANEKIYISFVTQYCTVHKTQS